MENFKRFISVLASPFLCRNYRLAYRYPSYAAYQQRRRWPETKTDNYVGVVEA